MTLSTDSTLVLIGIVAVISPIFAELTGRLAIPDVVFERRRIRPSWRRGPLCGASAPGLPAAPPSH